MEQEESDNHQDDLNPLAFLGLQRFVHRISYNQSKPN